MSNFKLIINYINKFLMFSVSLLDMAGNFTYIYTK